MTQPTLYQECPLCNEGSVVWFDGEGVYRCEHCHLTLKERPILGLFKKGRFGVADPGEGDYTLAEQSLPKVALRPDPLMVVLGNIYSDPQLA